jgi:hypothetical protein
VTVDELWGNIAKASVDAAVKAVQGKHVPHRIVTPSYGIDRQSMVQIRANTYPGETVLLRSQIMTAIKGCK